MTALARAPVTAKTLRVLLVGPSPHATGGMQRVFGAMGDYLANAPEVSVRMLDEVAAKRRNPGERSSPFALVRGSVRLVSAFREALAETRPGVVHVNAASGRSLLEKAMLAILAACEGVPAVVHLHGSRMDEEFPRMSRGRRAFLHRAFAPPNRAVVLSERSRRVFRDRFPDLDATVLPNAVDRVAAPPTPRPAPRHLGFLGALIGRKGEFDLIRAMARVSMPSDLLIAGDGSGRGEAEALASSLGLGDRVRFLGDVSGGDKAAFFRSIDVLCLPSHAENFPVALLEAMARGLPVIASPVAGVPEMVHDGAHGWLVPAGDVAGLAATIAEALGDPAELHRRGCLARGRVESCYAWDVVGPRWLDLYRTLAEGRGS